MFLLRGHFGTRGEKFGSWVLMPPNLPGDGGGTKNVAGEDAADAAGSVDAVVDGVGARWR